MIEDALLADGFEKALIGFGHQHNKNIAIYDYWECVKILMKRDKMTEEDAIEHMEYNVVGSYVGEYTPIFFNKDLLNGYST
jgi:hypothetical protein